MTGSDVLATWGAQPGGVEQQQIRPVVVDDVAPEHGCRTGVHGEELHRLDEHGTLKHAEMVRGNTGWDLVLTDRNLVGASSA